MSALACFGYFAVLTPLGVGMSTVAWPMMWENAGPGHRALGAVVGASGVLLAGGGVIFLGGALARIPA